MRECKKEIMKVNKYINKESVERRGELIKGTDGRERHEESG